MSRVHSVGNKASAKPIRRIAGNMTARSTTDMQAQKAMIRDILHGPALQAKPGHGGGAKMPRMYEPTKGDGKAPRAAQVLRCRQR